MSTHVLPLFQVLIPPQDLLYQLETTQNQLDRLQLDQSREAQYNRDGQLREVALHEQLAQVKMIMVRDLSCASEPTQHEPDLGHRTEILSSRFLSTETP